MKGKRTLLSPNQWARTKGRGSVFRYLIGQANMHGMDDPDRSTYYLLDEIEYLDSTIKRLGKLINVGLDVNRQAILSLQSVAQLEDTYGKERAHACYRG